MNYIADKDEFLQIVANGWCHYEGGAMYSLLKNLKGLKKEMKKLNWMNGNTFNRVKKLKQDLKDVQAKVDADPHNLSNKVMASKILDEYVQARHEEFLILQQKTKIKWLSEGDKNTKYFHKVLKARKQRAKVESICNENGVRFYGDEVAEQFVDHFKNFLGKTDNVKLIEDFRNIFTVTLNEVEANDMVLEVSDEEVKAAIFDIDSDKTAGPDGYTSHFFKKAWSVVGVDVCKAVKELFITGDLSGGLTPP
ncbi:uncharacterized protein [Rutidosis leptorrhynchoides]|uniref:uncharacterized protein n=1 Tax=Rutidosis leptorrhynchoides TaxID=125765 RepID=UPI003A9A4056